MAEGLFSRVFSDMRLGFQGNKLNEAIAEVKAARQQGKLGKAKQLLATAISQWEKEHRLNKASQGGNSGDTSEFQSEEGLTLYIENAEVLNALGEYREACASMRQAQSLLEPLRYMLDDDYVSEEKYSRPAYKKFSRAEIENILRRKKGEQKKMREQVAYVEHFISKNCP